MLVLNQRIWNELTEEEVLAVISHEAAHMHTGDAAINSLMLPFEYVNNFQQVYKNEENRAFSLIMNLYCWVFPLILGLPVYLSSQDGLVKLSAYLYLMVALSCYFLLVCIDGALLTSIHAKNREYLADALVMQWTMNPEALTGAIKRSGR